MKAEVKMVEKQVVVVVKERAVVLTLTPQQFRIIRGVFGNTDHDELFANFNGSAVGDRYVAQNLPLTVSELGLTPVTREHISEMAEDICALWEETLADLTKP